MDDAWQPQDIAPGGGGISIPTNDVSSGNPDEQTWSNGGGRSPPRGGPDAPRRSRSRSPGARDDRSSARGREDPGKQNPGNNLHVSGLSYKVDSRDLEAAFAKVGRVQKASVMYDPHSRESRGFGFVTMESGEEAEAAITALNATEFMGKVMTVEKARRGRARTPTPGRYYGPPKRGDNERPYDPRPFDSRYRGDDRRGGGRYDDYPRGGGGGGGRDYDRGGYGGGRDYDRGGYGGGGGGGGGGRDYDRGSRYDDRRY